MSGAPTGFNAPKTNWTTTDPINPTDLNRIEGNAAATELGSRTLDQALANPANVGTLRQLLSWFAGRIQAITGAANWWNAPATTLQAASAHHAAAAPHTGHETPTAAQAKVDTHAAVPAPHSGHSLTTHIQAVDRGGTGLTAYAAGDIVFASGPTALSRLPAGTAGQVLAMNGAATAPAWVAPTGLWETVASVTLGAPAASVNFDVSAFRAVRLTLVASVESGTPSLGVRVNNLTADYSNVRMTVIPQSSTTPTLQTDTGTTAMLFPLALTAAINAVSIEIGPLRGGGTTNAHTTYSHTNWPPGYTVALGYYSPHAAITSIQVFSNGSSFNAGSRFFMEGIRA